MTSRERNYLDSLWRMHGIDPRSDFAQVIEARVRLAEVAAIHAKLEEIRNAVNSGRD